MPLSPMDVRHLAGVDTTRAARLLSEVRSATLSGQRAPMAPRPVIEESWGRVLRSGVDPDHDARAGLLSRAEVQRRREGSALRHVLPVLREGLLPCADATRHIMVVADADGRVLWREGSPAVLRKADALGFTVGADWREDVVGTNGVGTPAVTRRPVQVFAAEHFVRSHAAWTCAGAPLTDPRDGRLIGVVDVSGPLETMHPSTLAWTVAGPLVLRMYGVSTPCGAVCRSIAPRATLTCSTVDGHRSEGQRSDRRTQLARLGRTL